MLSITIPGGDPGSMPNDPRGGGGSFPISVYGAPQIYTGTALMAAPSAVPIRIDRFSITILLSNNLSKQIFKALLSGHNDILVF